MKKMLSMMKFGKLKVGGIAYKLIFWIALLGIIADAVLIVKAFIIGIGYAEGWNLFVIGMIFLPINWIMASGMARVAWPQHFKN